MKEPRKSYEWRFCPTCGRDERWDRLRDTHYSVGKKCTGKPIVVRYTLTEVATTVEGDAR